jgi:hypothetical protein
MTRVSTVNQYIAIVPVEALIEQMCQSREAAVCCIPSLWELYWFSFAGGLSKPDVIGIAASTDCWWSSLLAGGVLVQTQDAPSSGSRVATRLFCR